MAATPPFCEALSEGIASGTLVDTKIILFSRKNYSGLVYGPKALYTSSHVLKSIPYFDHLLFGNFIEAGSKDFDETLDDDEYSSDYDYDSDSDLEDGSPTVVDALKGVLKKVVPPAKEAVKGALKKVVPPAKKAVKETMRKIIPENDYLKRALRADRLSCLRRGTLQEPPREEYSERPCKGKVVKVPDIAFITFQAFLLYLYTGEIEFAPIKSVVRLRRRTGLPGTSHDDVPRPSPRSIYRLADKYDIPALKNLALLRIRLELQKRDIVEETFSKFASKYDEIRSEYVTQLLSAIVNDTNQTVSNKVSAIIDRHSRGDLEHVGDALSLLWRTANQQGGAVASSSAAQVPPPPVKNPTNWKILKAAMLKSIRQGVFFDQKCWAKHSKDGRVLKPVYFSSLITGNALRKCIAHSNGREAVMERPRRESDAESDCEGGPAGAEESTSALSQVDEDDGKVRAILTSGSFAAWRSLFFYLCTDNISFAPLKSQGADLRLDYIKNASGTPPPCSPKSIYALARFTNIQPLRELSFRDIESKLSEDNIVEELSSHVSSTFTEVREMECRLFFSRFQNETTIRRMQERFAGVGASRSAHQADALKLGLQSALDIKKRDDVIAKGGVMLRCRDLDCPGNRSYTSYHLKSFMKNEFCQPCFKIGKERFLFCSGCGRERKGRHTSCQSCRKKFLLVASFPG